jgi:hypothetical protein
MTPGCSNLYGMHIPFSDSKIDALYPTHKLTQCGEDAVKKNRQQGFVLKDDAEEIIRRAESLAGGHRPADSDPLKRSSRRSGSSDASGPRRARTRPRHGAGYRRRPICYAKSFCRSGGEVRRVGCLTGGLLGRQIDGSTGPI